MGVSEARVFQTETGHENSVPGLRVITAQARACGFRTLVMFIPKSIAPLSDSDNPDVCIVPPLGAEHE